ncbi:MAG: hypothetical protein VKP62_02885 [Candidatus Sericytochromatia bacterium]|nr:hypothetical protein [Candidatus Sericytochromatia bacterium]
MQSKLPNVCSSRQPWLTMTAVAGAAWLLDASPAQAYVDPTAAGAGLQSMYVLLASAFISLSLIPQKLAALSRLLKQRLLGPSSTESALDDPTR